MSISAKVLLNRLMSKARFRHFEVLVRLNELGSVKRTAESIGMTQPGVTQLLADLEDLLEVTLFHRHARGVLPTKACQDLLPMARQCLLGLSSSAEAIADRSTRGQGVVRIKASTAGINGLLVEAIPLLNEKFPGIQLHIHEAEVNDQFAAISKGEIELGICRQPVQTPSGWHFEALLPDEFVVVCNPSHRLAKKKTKVTWQDLSKETWVLSPIGSAARDKFEELCIQYEFTPLTCHVITRVSSMSWAMMQKRSLVTLVPGSVFQQLKNAHQLTTVKLKDKLPFDPLGLLLPEKDVSMATHSVATFLRHFCQQK
jgi:DNA-binding transcriptional LysR family regulator